MIERCIAAGIALVLALGLTAESRAQGRQTGTIRGTASDSQQLVLPGVVVTVRSGALQGIRTTASGQRGAYQIPGLPPGVYTVTFELDGFTTVGDTVTVPLGGEINFSVAMEPGARAEAVQVTAVPPPLASTETSRNLTANEFDRLPLDRSLFRLAELSPGLTSNAPNPGQLTINGAFGYDNVFLIDGVDVSDNIFGTEINLFIEDTIEEAHVLTSGISAEYGRFSGGVVNVITKSGSNTFSGAFRSNLYKPDWTERTPFEVANDAPRTGSLANNTTYETTVGGPIVEDRLWFLYGNRRQRSNETEAFGETGISYQDKLDNDRNLFKLTATVKPGHLLEGSYMRNSTDDTGPTFGFTIDPAGIRTRQVPADLVLATYRGAATPRLFTEFQFSRRRFGFRNNGGRLTGIAESPFLTLTQAFGHYNAPYFDATDPQNRDNRQFTGSATYYVDTSKFGGHSIKGGFEHFTSTLKGGNSQTATGFVFDADYAVGASGSPSLDAEGRLMPVFVPGASLIENWRPLRGSSLDIRTLSFYLNDNWQLGNHYSFNVGVRAEKVDSEATGNVIGVDSSAIVPRLAAAVDPTGSGRYVFQATYAHYAGRYGEAQFNQNSNVGIPDLLLGVYTGPAGQGRDFAPGFEPDNYQTVFGLFPSRNVFFDDNLRSPLTKEFTFGGGAAVGTRAYTKVTYIHRTTGDVVEDFFTLDGGSTEIVEDEMSFGTFTNQVYRNTDLLQRQYDGIELLGRYQVTDSFVLDASVTVQINNDGTFEGEATNRPSISSSAFDYPEITPADRYFPSGRLAGFQRHKTRVWGIYNLDLGRRGALGMAGVWRYNSGRAYSLLATNVGINSTQQAILDTLGYVSGPSARSVYFADGRGSGLENGYGLFDLSVTYEIPVWRSFRPWLKAEIFNVLNNDTQIAANRVVTIDPASPRDEFGIQTSYLEGARFGEATSSSHYPQYVPGLDGLRTFRVAMGLRF